MSDDLAYLGLTEAAELIRTRKLSPVEYTTALMARIERHDHKYNAFVALTPERRSPRRRQPNGKLQRVAGADCFTACPMR
jgi:Asp-tRNA(Asn)/Glu-tRNA(Gln) amidotransferase A subunit family amidase